MERSSAAGATPRRMHLLLSGSRSIASPEIAPPPLRRRAYSLSGGPPSADPEIHLRLSGDARRTTPAGICDAQRPFTA